MPKYEIGKYECEISGQGFQKAGTGTMQFIIQFQILGKIDPNDPSTLLSTMPGERKLYRAITDNTIDWVMEDLKSLGVEGLTSWAQLDPSAERADFIDLSGRKFDAACGSKAGQDGKSYEDWSIARNSGTAKPIEHAEKKDVAALDRLFGKHLVKKASPAPAAARSRGPVPVAAAAAQPAGGGVITDEDIPF